MKKRRGASPLLSSLHIPITSLDPQRFVGIVFLLPEIPEALGSCLKVPERPAGVLEFLRPICLSFEPTSDILTASFFQTMSVRLLSDGKAIAVQTDPDHLKNHGSCLESLPRNPAVCQNGVQF